MKKSSKFLVGGTFLIIAFVFAGSLITGMGMDFGLSEMIASGIAGLIGAARLVH